MLNNLYTFSVPAFLRGHAVLSELLRKGEAHAAGYKITPSALLTARLFPDMFPLTGQVRAACDTAKRATARLVGLEPPRFEDNEVTFEELYARIQRTLMMFGLACFPMGLWSFTPITHDWGRSELLLPQSLGSGRAHFSTPATATSR